MPSSASGLYNYNIERLKFRDTGAIKIPKSGGANILNRDTCYKLAIDVVIESVTKPEYRNLQTTPYHGFYGYATLVMRDCIAPKIQLQFGRNRIFEQRIVEAFQGWNDLAFYLQTTKRFLELLINSQRTGDPPSYVVNICGVEAYSVSWSEIDLRELYVLCPENTQFRIELSWISPKKFTDDCGKDQDGKSKEPDDPKKDTGLPANGTQPKKNDASNPWAGNTPFTPLGADSPYFNPKGSNLNNSNPDNNGEPLIPSSWGYFLKVKAVDRANPNNCVTREATYYYLATEGATISTAVSGSLGGVICGANHARTDVFINGSYADEFLHISPLEMSIIRSPNKPPTSVVFL